jgi:hypothetical protein
MHVSPSGAPGAQRTIAVTLTDGRGTAAGLVACAAQRPRERSSRAHGRPWVVAAFARGDAPIQRAPPATSAVGAAGRRSSTADRDATRSLLGSAPIEDGLRRRWRPNERNVSLRDDEPIEVIA